MKKMFKLTMADISDQLARKTVRDIVVGLDDEFSDMTEPDRYAVAAIRMLAVSSAYSGSWTVRAEAPDALTFENLDRSIEATVFHDHPGRDWVRVTVEISADTSAELLVCRPGIARDGADAAALKRHHALEAMSFSITAMARNAADHLRLLRTSSVV